MRSFYVLIFIAIPVLAFFVPHLEWQNLGPTRSDIKTDLPTNNVQASFPEFPQASAACPCTVSQDAFSMTLPFFSHNMSANAFYAYGVPSGSSANSGFEQSEHLILMLYEDTNTGEVSLIFIADIANDPTGGEMKVTISCLPNSAYVALSDDAGELTGAPPTITGDFFWATCCTDGGIVGGLGCGYSFTFDIDELSGISTITLLYGSPSNPIYIDLPSSECPFIFNCGGPVCCDDIFTLDAVIQNANCENTPDGSIDLEVTGDCLQTPMYEWSNGETTEDIENLVTGTYTVTVTDANGCSVEESYLVDVEFQNPDPTIDGPPWFCEGETVELSVFGNYSWFEWSTGENDPEIYVTDAGTYSVTVTSAEGCIGTASITIEAYPTPDAMITGPTEVCPGGSIELDAGPGFNLYEWSTGGMGQTTVITEAGFYGVIVTNSFGCSDEATIEIFELPGAFPTIFAPDNICAGQTFILEVDDIYETYLWSTGGDTPQIEGTAPGLYSVTVTNQEGCTGVAEWEVFESFTTPLTIIGDSLLCQGDSTILLAGGIFAGYNWSTGDMTPQILAGAPGTYILEVADKFGCRDTATITLDTFPQTDIQISGITTICPGDNTVLSAGSGHQSYLWSNGENTQDITVSTSGAYSVEILDLNGCLGTDTVNVTINTIDTTLLFTSSCHAQDTGVVVSTLSNQYGCDSTVIVSISFNLADTSYLFAGSCDPQNTGVDVQELSNQYGCDSVVVTTTSLLPSDTLRLDALTCDASAAGLDTIILSNQWGCDSAVIVETQFVPADTLYLTSSTCDPLVADTTATILSNQHGCDSVIIDQIALLPSSENSFSFSSCNPQDTGTVVQVLTNQFGCDSTVTWTTLLVSEDSCILLVEPTIIPGPCAGDPGQIQLDANLGTFPVQVIWTLQSTGSPQIGSWTSPFSPFFLPNLQDGTYILDLVDANGKEWMDTLTVSSPDLLLAELVPSASLNGYDLACAGDSTATLMVNYLSGGTLPFGVEWSTGEISQDISGLKAGNYLTTITDANGCTLVLEDTITEPPLLQATWDLFQDPCDGLSAQVTSTNVSGGTSPVTYVVNGGVLPSLTWPSLPEGSVNLEIRDINGCRVDTTVLIEPEEVFAVDLGPDQLVEEGKLIFLSANITPPSVSLGSIQWSPDLCADCLNPALRVNETTTVTITVTSLYGCTATDAVLIELDKRDIYIPNSFSPNNDGLNDLFAPQGDPEVEVVEFAIFDRWGEEVYDSGGFQLGDPDVGWDGVARGQPSHVDVYVYVMLLRWPDGQEKLFKGDVQLMK